MSVGKATAQVGTVYAQEPRCSHTTRKMETGKSAMEEYVRQRSVVGVGQRLGHKRGGQTLDSQA